MASPYYTRSRNNTRCTSASTIEPSSHTQRSQGGATGQATTTSMDIILPRHFCIALTNNPRILRRAQQELAFAATAVPPSHISTDQKEGQLPTPPPPPPPPPTQQQVQTQGRLLRSQQESTTTEQQVPVSILSVQEPTPTATATEYQIYEQNLVEDFKIQIQPILQNYLNKTKRTSPVNAFLDMSSMIQF